nr:class I SAM-dependent methyltransferase [uncultured Gellertiella sp.]
MATDHEAFAGSIPEIYQRLMVPMIFEPYAREMALRACTLVPARVLEIAAGTGAVTRELATRCGPSVAIIATDLNQPMLDIAQGLQPERDNVSFRKVDAQALPFDDGSFDVAICQFGVMFFPDKLQSYREVHRVLRNGGTYLLAVWDELAANEFVSVVQVELATRFAADPPVFMERTPHGYYQEDDIVAALKQAGFSEVVFETVATVSHAGSALEAATAYCQGTPLRMEIEARAPGELEAVTHSVAARLGTHFGDGPIEGRISAHLVMARK